MMDSSFNFNYPLGYYFFHARPRAIIRDNIFREMLDLKDVA
jgi:hypothetical protein